jgi:hypothetical protein
MNPLIYSRRAFLGRAANGLGHVALSSLLLPSLTKLAQGGQPDEANMAAFRTLAPKAKRIIYLFQSGGPSHVDLFDGKDALTKLHGTNLPDSVRGGQRVTGMTSGQASFPVARPIAPGKPWARPEFGFPTCCPTPSKSPGKSVSSARCTPRPSTTIPPSP